MSGFSEARSDLRLADIFSDGMILQRHKPIHLWGTGREGATVTVTLGDIVVANTIVGPGNAWTLLLPPQSAHRGLILQLTDGVTVMSVLDVGIGEVWIAGGQSNMEFQLEFDTDREAVFRGPMNPDIRFFDVPKISYEGQGSDFDYSLYGYWRACTPDDLRYFSAVGYYFADNLHKALDVPIGIVGCNWGGTPASAWAELARISDGPAAIWIKEYQDGLRQLNLEDEAVTYRSHPMTDHTDPFADPILYSLMRHGFTGEQEQELLITLSEKAYFPIGLLHPSRPGGLFETMVRTIAPYSARGIIWYQGEADAPHAEVHGTVLTAVIESWRQAWGDQDLPFLITQLAPFGTTPFGTGERFPEVRAQQAAVANSISQVWMASSSDAGMERDIHPKTKKPIGHRLALLARGHVYREDVHCDAPDAYDAHAVKDGVVVHLRNADELTWGGRALPLTVQSSNGQSISIDNVEVDGSTLLLFGQIPPGSTVLFAQTGYYDVDVRNSAHLPLLPFRLNVR